MFCLPFLDRLKRFLAKLPPLLSPYRGVPRYWDNFLPLLNSLLNSLSLTLSNAEGAAIMCPIGVRPVLEVV